MDKTLPNGTIVRGLPDDMTDDDFKRIAIQNGYATVEEFSRDTETAADYLSTVGEIGGGLAGAYYGAAAGTAVLPGLGTAIGGILGGAFGTAFGSATGEIAEAALEGRSVDGKEVAEQASEAAKTDVLFGVGFGIAGKALGTIAKPIYNMIRSTPSESSLEAAIHKAALDVKNGLMDAETAARTYDIPPESLSRFEQEMLKSEDDILRAANLQDKLERRGGRLLPSQVPGSQKGLAAQEIAQASFVLRREVDDAIDVQNKYIRDSFGEVLDTTAGLTRDETGKAIAALAEDTTKALKETVAPMYNTIDKLGKVNISTVDTIQAANDSLRKLGRNADASAKAAKQAIAKLPMFPQPKEVAKQVARLEKTKAQLLKAGGSGPAVKMLNDAIKGLEKKLTGPQFVDTTATQKLGTLALDRLIRKGGVSGIEGKYAKRAKDLLQLRNKMSFSEAHEELSNLKSLMRDMDADLGSKDSQAYKLMSEATERLESAMNKTASRLNPELRETYKAATDMYREGIKVINGDWIVKSLNKDNPAKIGEDLVAAGEQIGVDSVRALIAKAKELKSNNQGENILESMQSTYLNTLFSQRTARESEQFAEKMLQKPFRDTFNAIVDPVTAKQLDSLAKEVTLLQKGLVGSESAATLTVRGREIGAITDPGLVKTAVFGVIGNSVRNKLSAKAIQQNIKDVQQLNAMFRAGKKIPTSLVERFIENSGLTGIQAGQVANALLGGE